MNPWPVAAIWIVWFIMTVGTGYARSQPSDWIDPQGTRVSLWADLITVVAIVGAVAVATIVPAATLRADPQLTVGLGAVLAVLGISLRQWAAATLGAYFTRSVLIRAEHQVIATGPYRFVRHPGYAGVLVSLVGLALTLGNWLSVMVIVIGFFVATVPRINAEEAVLEANLGEPYRAYARGRKRLVPGVW